MSFTSGKFSHDPMPWVSLTSERHRVSDENGRPSPVERYRWFYEYAPRPEYDHHNPILVWLRAASEDRVMRAQYGASLVPLLAGDFLVLGALEDYTPEHIAHARRVLTKLAVLA